MIRVLQLMAKSCKEQRLKFWNGIARATEQLVAGLHAILTCPPTDGRPGVTVELYSRLPAGPFHGKSVGFTCCLNDLILVKADLVPCLTGSNFGCAGMGARESRKIFRRTPLNGISIL